MTFSTTKEEHFAHEAERCLRSVERWLYQDTSPVFVFPVMPYCEILSLDEEPPDTITIVTRRFNRRKYKMLDGKIRWLAIETSAPDWPYMFGPGCC